jgi:tRNA dimethylallyltransferase
VNFVNPLLPVCSRQLFLHEKNEKMQQPELIAIIGPTACGKTGFSVALAQALNGEIISGDSRQVYSQMDIGTGKDVAEYSANGQVVPCHLIDIRPPGYKYNIFEFQHDFFHVYDDVRQRGKMPILCGGSGLYIEAVLKGYQLYDVPENAVLRKSLENKSLDELTCILKNYKTLHNKTDVDSVRRAVRAIEIEEYCRTDAGAAQSSFPPINSLIVGLRIDREERRKRISLRLHQRLQSGMVEEVAGLLASGIDPQSLIYYGLEYKFITLYLTGQLTYNQMAEKLEIAIHQFAKRQMTWFRGMETRGLVIHWIDAAIPTEEKIKKTLNLCEITFLNTP